MRQLNAVHLGLLILACGVLLLVAGCTDGDDGNDGTNGTDGTDGATGATGPAGEPGDDAVALTARPLSSMVAVSLPVEVEFTSGEFQTLQIPAPEDIPDFVTDLVELYYNGDSNLAGYEFPLANASTDDVRALAGLNHNVVVSWLDPLTWLDTPEAPRFGANCDYIAYFGDGWEGGVSGGLPSNPPQWNGSGTSAWIWSNHEYISAYDNTPPQTTAAPAGQPLTFSIWLAENGVLTNDIFSNSWLQDDVDTYIRWHKRQIGGSWFKVVQDPATGKWLVDRSAAAKRYDSTSATLLKLTGATLFEGDHDDDGSLLPESVVVGIAGDCSGGQSPWGTIVTAEENVQDYYGDLEAAWPSSSNNFSAGQGYDPGGVCNPTYESATADANSAQYGRISDPNGRHNRDVYGWLAEMDPGEAGDEYLDKSDPGFGHKKLGAFGRARWENVTFVTDENWRLIDGEPVVMYAANDRRGGRIYKFVSSVSYDSEIHTTKAAVRALLDSGRIYVSHFAGLDNSHGLNMLATGAAPTESAPGSGTWILMDLNNTTDIAPNAAAMATELGDSGLSSVTVGAALQDMYTGHDDNATDAFEQGWGGLCRFDNQNDLIKNMFTACMKIGVMELNRPEDVEWNPLSDRLYIAFTYSGRTPGLTQGGLLDLDGNITSSRESHGGIFAIRETDDDPANATTFEFFEVWRGTQGTGVFDAGRPDNLMIDGRGGVWFGTDGNYGFNGRADALYYLDLDPSHMQPGAGGVATYGMAFRVAAGPSDAEATGPCLSSDMRTLFFNVQHPGEGVANDIYSTWPHPQSR